MFNGLAFLEYSIKVQGFDLQFVKVLFVFNFMLCLFNFSSGKIVFSIFSYFQYLKLSIQFYAFLRNFNRPLNLICLWINEIWCNTALFFYLILNINNSLLVSYPFKETLFRHVEINMRHDNIFIGNIGVNGFSVLIKKKILIKLFM